MLKVTFLLFREATHVLFHSVLSFPRDYLYKYLEIKFSKNVIKDLYSKIQDIRGFTNEKKLSKIYTQSACCYAWKGCIISKRCRLGKQTFKQWRESAIPICTLFQNFYFYLSTPLHHQQAPLPTSVGKTFFQGNLSNIQKT